MRRTRLPSPHYSILPISILSMKPSSRLGTRIITKGNESLLSEKQDWHFSVGSVSVSPKVATAINPGVMYHALARHAMGDWGDISEERRKINACALACRGQIASAYYSGSKKFWIVTDTGWRNTRILRAREYARLLR